jgi:hypothetical protein
LNAETIDEVIVGASARLISIPIRRPFKNKSRSSSAIARQTTWQWRVNQVGKGSRGIWIMPLMIVAGKRYFSI